MVSNDVTMPGKISPAAFDTTVLTRFLLLWLVAAGVYHLVFLGRLADPFVRHDDFPALLGLAETYYDKTLTEGRWLNYWWIEYVAPGSARANYIAYVLGWAAFAAAFAANTLRGRGPEWTAARVVLAALVVLTPQAYEISQWYNTLVPGVWLLAIYGILCLFLPRRTMLGLLLIFGPLTFTAYNTYPFLLFAMVLLHGGVERSAKDLFRVTFIFGVSFALGMALTYGLNWVHHGVFGIEVGDWREITVAPGAEGASKSFAILSRFVHDLATSYGVQVKLLGMAVFAMTLVCFLPLVRHHPREAAYAATPAAIGVGLLLVHSIMNGIFLPVRATSFVWVATSYVLVRTAMIPALTWWARGAIWALVLGLIVTIGARMDRNQGFFDPWQTMTRELAARVPDTAERIVIYGSLSMLEGAYFAGIQTENGLTYRMQYLTGLPVTNCWREREACREIVPPFDPLPRFGQLTVETAGDTTFIRTPAIEFPP